MNTEPKLKVTKVSDNEELQKLSTANLIIYILGRAEIAGTKLTAEDIAIECWLLNPEKHSLRGYPQFPDSFNVIKRLFDMKGRNGLVEGTTRSGFKLTQVSRARFEEISKNIRLKSTPDLRSKNADDRTITSIDEAPYKRLTRTPAYRKFQAGDLDKIVESDFLYFYGFSWNNKRPYIEGKIRNVDLVVNRFAEKDKVLKGLSVFLNERFAKLKESVK